MSEAKKIEAPVEEISIPLSELETVDVSEKHLEKMARGFIMGSQAIGRRREVRQELEDRVIKKIGKKGKYLTDKLFELIEGVYVIDKRGGKDGREVRYYQVPPNLQAIIYALDRVLGKPVTKTEITEEKKGIMVVEHIIRNLAGDNSSLQKSEKGLSLLNEKDLLKLKRLSRDLKLKESFVISKDFFDKKGFIPASDV